MTEEERRFVVKAPHEVTTKVRRALSSLTNGHGVKITLEKDDLIEFSSSSPSYAIFEIRVLSPSSVLRETRSGMEQDVPNDLPEWVEGILSCQNKNCITAQPKEPAMPKFKVVSIYPPKVQCYYCGRYVDQSSLEAQLAK